MLERTLNSIAEENDNFKDMSIEEVACIINEKCGLNKSPDQISRDLKTLRLRKEHPQICGLSQGAIQPILAVKDSETREKVLESVKKLVKTPKDPETGKMKKKVTAKDVQQVVKRIKQKKPSVTALDKAVEKAVVPRRRRKWAKPNPDLIRKQNYLLGAQLIQQMIDRNELSCPNCGEKKLVWGCCNIEVADPKYIAQFREEIKA